MTHASNELHGAGLGLRRPLLGPIAASEPRQVEFLEVAPENWLGVGGRHGRSFRSLTELYPFAFHGLSLSLGGPGPLDEHLVYQIKGLIAEHRVSMYSEHLSSCGDDGHLYDLMPIPFTADAVAYVAARIRRVQDILERRIAIENVSYYVAPPGELDECTFLNAILAEADCDLLLDVNNVYVNSVNHGYDPVAFLQSVPAERIAYLHVAGHYRESDDLIVDTHGANVVDPVWELLGTVYELFGALPTLLERDFNLPPLEDLLTEVARIRSRQNVSELEHPRHVRSA